MDYSKSLLSSMKLDIKLIYLKYKNKIKRYDKENIIIIYSLIISKKRIIYININLYLFLIFESIEYSDQILSGWSTIPIIIDI